MLLPVIVLCGGTSHRLDPDPAIDKTRAELGAGTVLDHLLDSLPDQWSVICVGAPRHTNRLARWTREDPIGGGPVAGLAAGLVLVDQPVVAVVAGDLPFAADALRRLVGRLCATVPADLGGPLGPSAESPAVAIDDTRTADLRTDASRVDAAVGFDAGGHVQPLLAAYRTGALRRALPHQVAGARARSLLQDLLVLRVACDERECLDVDTPRDLQRARHMVAI